MILNDDKAGSKCWLFLLYSKGKHPRNKHSNFLTYINVYPHELSFQTGAFAPYFEA